MKIPKRIHYCWFGGNPKSEIIEKCIASWKKHCPDWEIKEWNETNFDISALTYTQEAYEAKKWAFVSDVARLHAVYEDGGLYLDTDVELLQPIDGICDYEAVYAFETNLNINTGMGFGAVDHHKSVEKMLEVYRDRHFIVRGKPDLMPCPKLNTDALRTCYPNFARNGNGQEFEGVRVLSGGEYAKYAKHHATGSWDTESLLKGGKTPAKKPFRDTKLKRMLREPAKYDWIEKKFGEKALAVYTFCTYDLLENGPWFYIKNKLRRK